MLCSVVVVVVRLWSQVTILLGGTILSSELPQRFFLTGVLDGCGK